jgi:raffinose synthase
LVPVLCRFGIRYVYCWHGLPAYWGGVMPGTPSLAGVTGSKLVYPKPTASIAEVEPSLMWSPAVLAGGHCDVLSAYGIVEATTTVV